MALDLNDKTANANNLTNVNTVTEETSNLPFAASTSAANFVAASSQHLWAADSASLSVTGSFTIEAWVYFVSFASGGNDNVIVAKFKDSVTVDESYFFSFFGGTQIRLIISSDGNYNASNDIRNDWAPSLNTWYHVAVVYDSTVPSVKFYVNGVQQGATGTPAATSIFNGTKRVAIGAYRSEASPLGYFDGKIDEVRIWNTVRTVTEISNNYQQELVGNESGLVAYWPFETLAVSASASASASSSASLSPSGSLSPSASASASSSASLSPSRSASASSSASLSPSASASASSSASLSPSGSLSPSASGSFSASASASSSVSRSASASASASSSASASASASASVSPSASASPSFQDPGSLQSNENITNLLSLR